MYKIGSTLSPDVTFKGEHSAVNFLKRSTHKCIGMYENENRNMKTLNTAANVLEEVCSIQFFLW